MLVTPKNAALIADWCKNSNQTVEVPVVILQRILRELKVAEILFDSASTHKQYYHEQNNQTREFMLESSSGWLEHEKEAKQLSVTVRDMLVDEYIKSTETV